MKPMAENKRTFEERFNVRFKPEKRNKVFPLEDELEKSVAETLKSALDVIKKDYSSDKFRLVRNAYFKTALDNQFEVDLLLLSDELPLAIIEVKRNIKHILHRIENQFVRECNILNCQFFFLCSGSEYELYVNRDRDGLQRIETGELSPENLTKAINCIINKDTVDASKISPEKIGKHLCDIIEESKISADIKPELKSIITEASLEFADNKTFHIDSKSERKFFTSLLGKVEQSVCRYTTVTSIYRTLNDKRQSMCSIICMNDRSEIEYASKKIGHDTAEMPKCANNCYILSCCDINKKDNLTMWRLYADDGKGVNIEYDIDQEILFKENSPFIMAPISYAAEDGIDKNLQLIKDLLETNIDGAKFILNEWEIWQHFFKPYDYQDEKEIRLLFWKECASKDIDDRPEDIDCNDDSDTNKSGFERKWILESNYGIIAPIVTLDISKGSFKFPLKIKSIIIGPKNKEKDINRFQISELARYNNLLPNSNDTFTYVSKIDHYR